jgi:shikimate dehydrogenase
MASQAKGAPQKSGIIGWPVSHSRSPLLHTYWMQKHNIQASYERCPVNPADDFRAALEAMAQDGFVGANVTIPHKETAFAAMDSRTEAAQKLGAVNTIVMREGRLLGANTDGEGFIASLEAGAADPDWRQKPALVLGAGGAARAILAALEQAGVGDIRLVNRTRARAEALAPSFGQALSVGDWQVREGLAKDCGLLVNTTSLGMQGAPALDMGLQNLADGAVVTDIVYTPLETDLLARARASGFVAIDGLGMLMHQAAASFEMWFGVRPQVDAVLRALLVEDLA